MIDEVYVAVKVYSLKAQCFQSPGVHLGPNRVFGDDRNAEPRFYGSLHRLCVSYLQGYTWCKSQEA